MLSVFICEDDDAQRKRIEQIVTNYIMIEEFDMELILSTKNPYNILTYLTEYPNTRGIYFLDIDLRYDINGIQLGSQIREKDINGKIIFITTHSELLILTFTYKVEAMDYILKDDTDVIQQRIYEDLEQAQKHYQSENKQEYARIKLKIGNQIRVFSVDSIIFIETSPIPHKLILHLENNTIEFYGKINEIEELAPNFILTHKSYLVNYQNIVSLDKKKRKIIMRNGEHCFYSVRKLKQLEETLMSE